MDRMQALGHSPDRGPPIGAGALAASFRQGPKELAPVLPAFPDSVRVIEEPGAVGNPVPLEVYQAKRAGQQERIGTDLEMGR